MSRRSIEFISKPLMAAEPSEPMNRNRWPNRLSVGEAVQAAVLWAVLVIHATLLAGIATVNAPMFDEIAHLPSGLSHWKFRNFDLYKVNPPLMRMIAAVPLLVVNPKTDWSSLSERSHRSEFAVGTRFMEINGPESFWYFTICRWAQIPVSIFGGWVCFHWAREMFACSSSGFVALILWCFCPNVLAWGSTITPDLGAAAFGVGAGYTFWRWLKDASWHHACLAGLALGIAELSKSTWIVLFAVWPTLWFAWRRWGNLPSESNPKASQLIAVLFIGLYVLNLGYGFEGSFQRLDQFEFISSYLRGGNERSVSGNRFRGTLMGLMPVPVPANYLRGIDIQKYDFEAGKWSYLGGETKLGGWHHYYLYALAVKTPIGTLFLLLLSTLLLVRRGFRARFRDELVLLAPALAAAVLVSSQTGFSRYLRYVLPAIPFVYIYCARAGKAFNQGHLALQAAVAVSTTASIVASILVYPHSMSFFNSAAGGPLGGPAHLLDANIDWGQDLLELKRFVRQNPNVGTIGLAYFGFVDPKLAQFPCESFAWQLALDPERPLINLKPGWYAVSVNHVFGYKHDDAVLPLYADFQRLRPTARAGYSIYIYNVTPEAIEGLYRPVPDIK